MPMMTMVIKMVLTNCHEHDDDDDGDEDNDDDYDAGDDADESI